MFNFDLREDERVLAMYRKAEALLIKPALYVAVLMYVPWTFLLKYELAYQYRWWLLILTIIVVLYAIHAYVVWLLNVSLLTDRRLVVVTYHTLFHKEVREAELAQITNVSFISKGMTAFALGLGTVEVYIRHQNTPLVITHLKNPDRVKDAILTAKSRGFKVEIFH